MRSEACCLNDRRSRKGNWGPTSPSPPPMVVDLLKTEDCTEDETGSGQVFIGHCTNCGKFCEKKRFVIL